jgi:Holliday junction DNA helicase RuvA
MIGSLHGILLEKAPPLVRIDCHGVGYEVFVPMSTFYNLSDGTEKVTLLTQLVVRDDAHVLYGFQTAKEREAFRALIKIPGVGPRTALAILSGMSTDDLIESITQQESTRLMRIPGIGRKTVERLLLELRDKLTPYTTVEQGGVANTTRSDVLQALLALGYSEKEAYASLKKLPEGVDVNTGIKLALKNLIR